MHIIQVFKDINLFNLNKKAMQEFHYLFAKQIIILSYQL